MKHSVILAGFFAGGVFGVHAQWLNYPAPGTPRTADGKPNLSAPAPRLSNGKPDLSGVWLTQAAAPGEIERLMGAAVKTFSVPGDDLTTFSKYAFNILADFKPEDSPLRPEAKRSVDAAVCLPMGLPLADVFNFAPFKMIQTPSVIAVLYEGDGTYRQIHMAARFPPTRSPLGWATQSAGGTVTRWWSMPRVSTPASSTLWATRTAKTSTFRSAFSAAISATWT